MFSKLLTTNRPTIYFIILLVNICVTDFTHHLSKRKFMESGRISKE